MISRLLVLKDQGPSHTKIINITYILQLHGMARLSVYRTLKKWEINKAIYLLIFTGGCLYLVSLNGISGRIAHTISIIIIVIIITVILTKGI